MASNPPCHVMEDQTDEDFFDKLVDDDFGPTNSDSVPKFTEGSDSDEAKAFAKLSIEDASGEGGAEVKARMILCASARLSGLHVEESNTLDSSNSLGSNTIVESNNDGIESEVVPDPVLTKTIESSNSGVKEVGWSSFYADSVPNRNHEFGSYSDFFNDLGDTSQDFPGKVNEAANLENSDGDRLHNSAGYGEYQDGAQSYGGSAEEGVNGQDLNSSQYWENMYPGGNLMPTLGSGIKWIVLMQQQSKRVLMLVQQMDGHRMERNQQLHNSYDSNVSMYNHVEQQKSFNSLGTVPSYDKLSQGNVNANGFVGSQSFIPSGNFSQQFNQGNLKQNEHMNVSNDYYSSQKPVNFSLNNQQFSYAHNTGISSAGRPPHALVTFGFGGKLVVMKDGGSSSLGNTSFGSQAPVGGSISVLNLMEVISGNTNNAPNIRGSTCNYFRALWQQSFPEKENTEVASVLLKIACQHYGKLRSPFGTDASLTESDAPESAVAKLFASAKQNGSRFSDYGAFSHCLQSLPSEGQIQATASEVQNLLVSGRKKEALQCAQVGQLWGPALVLASQLGDQFYVDTVKQMALRQLVVGSPLRTLCLLIAGQPADVFSNGTTTGIPGAMSQQPIQFEANGMLDDWEENLAVITANRTKDDELVIIHLGDCLWKERSEITGAHICYLVAETNFESYSDSARLCLIGADHWKHPRTYANPEAIQRTELYEYSKVLGNSQYILLPFQPYKLIYAYMLAEVGKVSDSLKYCQAILKSLKTGRAQEVETWKQLVLSLEERIRTHQQGGYTANLAPAKLVGNEHHHQPMVPRVSASQSTMAMSSLMPSASMEPISEWAADGNRMTMHNRSVSEPDIGRTPRQVESPKEGTSSSAQSKTSGSGTASRFGRFGFGSQLLQKTVGLVLRPRSDRQAKLGEKNKFYYDEKLKRWVEEGAEPPTEEAVLQPPPTTSAFQNGMSDYNLKSALKSDGSPTNGSPTSKTPNPVEHSSGIPPIPTSSNQFSARGRMGVRAR
ncbi:hypothetical protein GH714_030316 [Hevea brasiliensis]|uniref:Protein transport protein sec16 n=1 Tax=Hevea brasiliensis TaxID=3981 RepID=A0A6A6LCD0_HEVBR|nr:hypothetical protein GH714_030316 [Hevea brasiliensis]